MSPKRKPNRTKLPLNTWISPETEQQLARLVLHYGTKVAAIQKAIEALHVALLSSE